MTTNTKTERTLGDRTRWSDIELPRELRHPDIAFHRDVGMGSHEAYQIGFDQSWMPYDYNPDLPEEYHIQYARLERHHPPYRPRWLRILLPKRNYVVIVVSDDY